MESYGVAKWYENSNSMCDFKVQYTCTLTPNMLTVAFVDMLNKKHKKYFRKPFQRVRQCLIIGNI